MKRAVCLVSGITTLQRGIGWGDSIVTFRTARESHSAPELEKANLGYFKRDGNDGCFVGACYCGGLPLHPTAWEPKTHVGLSGTKSPGLLQDDGWSAIRAIQHSHYTCPFTAAPARFFLFFNLFFSLARQPCLCLLLLLAL